MSPATAGDPKLSESEVLAKQTIHPQDLARFMAQIAQSCRIYRPRDQFGSADTVINRASYSKFRTSGVGGGLDFAIANEVGKRVRSGDVALFVAIKLSPTLDCSRTF